MEAKRLQQELAEAKAEISLLKQDLQDARSEIDHLELVNSNLMTFTAQASAKPAENSLVTELELQISELKTQKEKAENDITQLTVINNALQSEVEIYQADIKTMRCTINDLTQQFHTLSTTASIPPVAQVQTQAQAPPPQLDEVTSLKSQVARLEHALAGRGLSGTRDSLWEERCYQAEARITELEVQLAGAEKYASQYRESQRLLENARAEIARQISSTGHSPRELEDLLSECKVELAAANEYNKRIKEQYDKLADIKNKQDERLRKMSDIQRQNDTLTTQLELVNAELTRLRQKEKEYSNILSSVDSHNLHNDERIRELEQRHRLELSRREEVIAGLQEEKSRLTELTRAQKVSLHALETADRMQLIRGVGSLDTPAGDSRPMSAQTGSMRASIGASSPALDNTLGYQVLSTSRTRSRPSTALKATMQLRLASRTLKNVMG